MLSLKLAVISCLAACGVSKPLDTRQEADVLSKRATEGVHLVNCGTTYSGVLYCPNDSNCNHPPGAGNWCSKGRYNELFHWEGAEQACGFVETDTVFVWNIQADAQSKADYSYAGTAYNDYHSFNCYKDDHHTMYNDGNGLACHSIYYCLPK